MAKKRNILFCPLDWGMGHATRITPIIKSYIDEGFNPIVATSEYLIPYFKDVFPNIETTIFKGPKIKYQKGENFTLKAITQIHNWIRWIFLEKRECKKLIEKYDPLLIVSDNRYGARNKNCFSVIITHQPFVILPKKIKFLEPLTHKFLNFLITKFNQCWIPDFSVGNGLSGSLSRKKKLPVNAKFIGTLSRFMILPNLQQSNKSSEKTDILVILSGPEPQKTILKNKLLSVFENFKKEKIIFIVGEPEQLPNKIIDKKNNIEFYFHLSLEKFHEIISNSQIIISRAGYSSVMDYHFFNKKAILIPTPGQTEQEYLSNHFSGNHLSLLQNEITFTNVKSTILKLNNKT